MYSLFVNGLLRGEVINQKSEEYSEYKNSIGWSEIFTGTKRQCLKEKENVCIDDED